MAVLAVDTSSPIASLSIGKSDGTIVSIEAKNPNSHIETLSLLLDQLLLKSQIKIKDLESIILGAGPGSFTGLRIGYSFVAGLAVALKIPVAQISSLQAATNLDLSEGLQVVLVDARRGEYFAGIYQFVGNRLLSVWPEQIIELQYLADILSQKLVDLSLLPSDLKIYASESITLLNQISSQIPFSLSANLIKINKLNPLNLPEFSVNAVSNLTPNYLRLVAAVKLNEPRTV